MKENFNKFKKKVWLDIIVKCAVIALAAGLVAVNAVLLPCKLYGIKLFWLYYVLIAFGGTALGGGISFLFLRTNDKKIAMRLDSELLLNERVQTALQCTSGDSDMISLLNADATNVLGRLPARSLPFKNLVITVLCCVIAFVGAVAIPVVGFTVPPVFAETSQSDGGNKEPPRDVTKWEYDALDDLIKYVNDSKKLDEPSKSGMLSALNSLRDLLLKGSVTQNGLEAFVRNTAAQMTKAVADANEAYPNVGNEQAPQAKANSEELTYVVSTLYSIFKMLPEGGNTPGDNSPKPNEGDDDPDPSGHGSSGVLNENETPFFDGINGFVTCGSVRAEYMAEVQKALEEGTISKEEWEFIMLTYFADLGKNNNED